MKPLRCNGYRPAEKGEVRGSYKRGERGRKQGQVSPEKGLKKGAPEAVKKVI